MEKDLGDRLVHPSLAFCSAHYYPSGGGFLSRMVTRMVGLRFEALPTHMKTSLAAFALFCKWAGCAIEVVTNRLLVWRHLMTVWWQLQTFLLPFNEIALWLGPFALPPPLGMVRV